MHSTAAAGLHQGDIPRVFRWAARPAALQDESMRIPWELYHEVFAGEGLIADAAVANVTAVETCVTSRCASLLMCPINTTGSAAMACSGGAVAAQ